MSSAPETKNDQRCPLCPSWQEQRISGWRKSGEDRTCAYCGSWHPEELRAWLPQVDGLERWVELNDHLNKIYIHRPDIPNASAGAIKFKVAHIQGDDLLLHAINKALKISNQHFEQRLERTMERSRKFAEEHRNKEKDR